MLKKFNPFNKWTIGEKRKKNYNFFRRRGKLENWKKFFCLLVKIGFYLLWGYYC